MASSFPTSVDNFVDRQDGIDIIQAADINDAYAGVESAQTFIGASGESQSRNVDLYDFLLNETPPLVSKASSSTLSISAGAIAVGNSGQTKRMLRRKTTATTVSASDIDTGALVIGYYYVYIVADAAATTYTVKFSASATAPTGLTNFALIGWFYNEANGSLDVTTGHVGNTRRKGVENEITYKNTTDLSTSSTTYQSLAPTIRFYAPSLKILVIINHKAYVANADESGAVALNVDGSEHSDTIRGYTNRGLTGSTWPTPLAVMTPLTIAAAQTVIIPKIKATNGAYTAGSFERYIYIKELPA